MNYDELKKPDIDKLCKELFREIDANGYLDHETRAVEKMVSDAHSTKGKTIRFKIFKHECPRSRYDVGAAFICKNYTADIHYSERGSRLDKLLAIGHELGHIALNHVNPMVPFCNTAVIKDRKMETQATYFARLVTARRAGQYGDKDFYESRHFDEESIDKAIVDLRMVYDESELL